MNTPSHCIINAALSSRRRPAWLRNRAWLLGAVLPDLPLYALTVLGMLYYRLARGMSERATFNHIFDTMYFNDPLWKAAHNFWHAPLMLLTLAALMWRRRATSDRAAWWLSLSLGCLIHSVVDLLTHVNDGPLVFFPFDWQTRFAAPVSYWDRRYHGRGFAQFELALDALLLAYLLAQWAYRRWLTRKVNH